MNQMKEKFQEILTAITLIGGETKEVIFEEPSSEDELFKIEEILKHRIPEEFRQVLLNKSSHCELSWFLSDDFALPEEFKEIFSGNIHWGTKFILLFNKSKDDWIKEVFPNPEDDYDKVWHNKFVFQEVGNGDYLAIDLNKNKYGKIIYLSHDDGEGHGCIIANNFNDLVNNWIKIGFVGAEDWQWLPFVENKQSGILPESKIAIKWKKLIRLI